MARALLFKHLTQWTRIYEEESPSKIKKVFFQRMYLWMVHVYVCAAFVCSSIHCEGECSYMRRVDNITGIFTQYLNYIFFWDVVSQKLELTVFSRLFGPWHRYSLAPYLLANISAIDNQGCAWLFHSCLWSELKPLACVACTLQTQMFHQLLKYFHSFFLNFFMGYFFINISVVICIPSFLSENHPFHPSPDTMRVLPHHPSIPLC